jgi:hypothetical protein
MIGQLIKTKLQSLRPAVEEFITNPEPPIWVPPNNATPSNREFLINLQIPLYNEKPSLLLHDLHARNVDEIKEHFGSTKHLFVVYYACLEPFSRQAVGVLQTHPDQARRGAYWKASQCIGVFISSRLQMAILASETCMMSWQNSVKMATGNVTSLLYVMMTVVLVKVIPTVGLRLGPSRKYWLRGSGLLYIPKPLFLPLQAPS